MLRSLPQRAAHTLDRGRERVSHAGLARRDHGAGGGLAVTLVTWLRQRYRPRSGSRHVDHVWFQTTQGRREPLRDKPRLVVTQGATVVLWLPYAGGARLVTVTAPGRTDDLVRQLQPLTPALQESIPLQVAAEAVQKSCLRAEDGGLLLDIGVLRQVAFVAVRGGSAVLAAGDRLDLLDDPGPHDGSGPPAVRRHRLPTDDRLVVLGRSRVPVTDVGAGGARR